MMRPFIWDKSLPSSTAADICMPVPRLGGGAQRLSLASQLPQGNGNFSDHSKSVGAWLASDAGDRVPVFNRWQASSHRGAATFQHTANLWEPGLPAMRGDRVSLFNRWQASSHRGSGSAHHCSAHSSHSGSGNFSDDSKSVGAGLPAMRATGCLCSIPGKPAPTKHSAQKGFSGGFQIRSWRGCWH